MLNLKANSIYTYVPNPPRNSVKNNNYDVSLALYRFTFPKSIYLLISISSLSIKKWLSNLDDKLVEFGARAIALSSLTSVRSSTSVHPSPSFAVASFSFRSTTANSNIAALQMHVLTQISLCLSIASRKNTRDVCKSSVTQ